MRRVIDYLVAILVALFLISFIFVVTTAYADTKSSEWLKWSSDARTGYVIGAVEAAVDTGAFVCPSGHTFAEVIVSVQALSEKEPDTDILEVIARSLIRAKCTFHPRSVPAPSASRGDT
jgi:hypothetical protein